MITSFKYFLVASNHHYLSLKGCEHIFDINSENIACSEESYNEAFKLCPALSALDSFYEYEANSLSGSVQTFQIHIIHVHN
jgi:hypothetical protein